MNDLAVTEKMETVDTQKDQAEVPVLRIPIGKAVYLVGIHFNKDSPDTLMDKITRMIQREIRMGSSG